jgi:hypothetical protein
MAYDTKNSFAIAIYEAADYYHKMERKLGLKPFNINTAWGIYTQARRPHLGFAVMGRTVVERFDPTDANYETDRAAFFARVGNAIDTIEHTNLTVNGEAGKFGSICHFFKHADGKNRWNFAYNDAWVLGGVHSRLEFHIASPRRLGNVWLEADKEMGVTGRELCGLKTFGYSVVKSPVFFTPGSPSIGMELEEIAVCRKPTLANNASFADYIKAVHRYNASKARVIADLVDLAAA